MSGFSILQRLKIVIGKLYVFISLLQNIFWTLVQIKENLNGTRWGGDV